MNILFLTDKKTRTNGYAVVGENIRQVLGDHFHCQVDCFSTDDYRNVLPGKTSLKSTLYEKYGFWVILWDLLTLVLFGQGKRYDIIHCNVEHFAVVAWLYSLIYNLPYTVTVHGTYGVVLPLKYRLFARAFRKAARVIAVSAFTMRRMHEESIRAQIEVVGNGVDRKIFFPIESVIKKPQFLFVGNDKPRKGFLFLYEALCLLAKKGVKSELIVVGKFGPTQSMVASRALADGVSILFTGKVSEEALLKLYRESALNILPSRSEPFYFEGYGLIHAEAIAAGTLTLGCRYSGNEDAILDGNGWLVDYGDVTALSEKLEAVLCHMSVDDWRPTGPCPMSWYDVTAAYMAIFNSIVSSYPRTI